MRAQRGAIVGANASLSKSLHGDAPRYRLLGPILNPGPIMRACGIGR